ncbi:MAG TPA: metal ABC transporter substrate-binding protein [Planctomycetota bacterium]|nr:metal ABC transporter substrate-binding protein [Planctomycetota bacterium]
MFCRILLVLSLLSAASCGSRNSPQATTPETPKKLKVSATLFVLADWLRNIGGEHLDVVCLVAGSATPHHFEPGTHEAVAVSTSRALFAIGLEIDPWAAKLAKSAGNVGYIETGAWITPRKFTFGSCCAEAHQAGHTHEHTEGGPDPHFWHDPSRVITVVEKLAAELARLDPDHASDYRKNGEHYVAKLGELNVEVARLATKVPADAKLVTFHDAYSYLFERVKITLAGVIQLTPGIEPSLRDMAASIRMMKEIKQKVVFKEPLQSDTAADRIAQEIGARVELLDPMDSEAGADLGGYIERFRGNLKRLEGAFQ